MFSALLFGQTVDSYKSVEQAAHDSKEVCIYKTMCVFPTAYELTRLLNCFDPDVVLVELTKFEDALLLAREIRVMQPEAAVIGFAPGWDGSRAEEVAAAGVVEVLRTPLTEQSFQQGLAQAMGKLRPTVRDNLLAFLPAKAGSGATTVALNVAGCLAADQEQKVLVMEGDLRSGLISVLLKLNGEYSILDALENAMLLDGALWNRIVVKAHGLELLVSPRPRASTMVSWASYHQLLQFVRPRYDTVVVDLPELVNEATVEVVRRARRVFIVTTPELPSLVLARQRWLELRDR
ncbi:MAG: AAA family ATPase, partial [Acidobacteria bacterium]|nr:AAA family ATPase [Acidobacteriota bacterium]